MIIEMMRDITDVNDYMTILTLLKDNTPLTKEDVNILVSIYSKYGYYINLEPDPSETEFARVCLVSDIMKLRETIDHEQFANFGLTNDTLDAIIQAKLISDGLYAIDETNASEIVSKVLDENRSKSARVVLARVALDAMALSDHFNKIQRQIREIANFLIGIKSEAHKYALIVNTMRGG